MLGVTSITVGLTGAPAAFVGRREAPGGIVTVDPGDTAGNATGSGFPVLAATDIASDTESLRAMMAAYATLSERKRLTESITESVRGGKATTGMGVGTSVFWADQFAGSVTRPVCHAYMPIDPAVSMAATTMPKLRHACDSLTGVVAHEGASSSASSASVAVAGTNGARCSRCGGITTASDDGVVPRGRGKRTVACELAASVLFGVGAFPRAAAFTSSRRRWCASSHCFQSAGTTHAVRIVSKPSAPAHRAAGFFCNIRSTMYCNRAGTALGRSSSIVGSSSCFCLKMTLYRVSPSHGRSPVNISHDTRPRLYTSDRAFAGAPSICSGDM